MQGKVVIGTSLDTKQFDAQIKSIEKELEAINKRLSKPQKYGLAKDDIANLTVRAEKLNNKLVSLNAQKKKLEEAPTGMQKWMSSAGKETDNVVKKVGKWALALLGVRSIMNLVRSSVSLLASEDEQIATDLEYMRWILAQTLKPVVEWLIQGLYTLLALVNSISMSLFGFNILAGKSADAFKQTKKSVGGVSSALKEAKKQLAGFDEMNVLQEDTSGGGGGGGIGGGIDDWTPPDWGKSEEQVEDIKSGWLDIGETLRKYIEEAPWSAWINGFGLLGITLKGVTEFIYGLWNIITGFVQFVIGVVQLIVGFVTGDTEKMSQGIQNIIDGLVKIVTGIIYTFIGMVHEWVGIIAEIVYEVVMAIWNFITKLWDWVYNLGKTIGEWIKEKINGIKEFFFNVGYAIGSWLKEKFTSIGNWIGDKISDFIHFVKEIPGKIKTVFEGLVSWFSGLWDRITNTFRNFGTSVGNAIGGAFKSAINAVLGVAESVLNTPINAINSLIGKINSFPGINLGRLSNFSLPRLARGGIVNNPGRGVMMGSYVAGENGAEAVLPLTDDTLQRLANMIPITVNLTNTMNGRVISRELIKVQNENDFAFNR